MLVGLWFVMYIASAAILAILLMVVHSAAFATMKYAARRGRQQCRAKSDHGDEGVAWNTPGLRALFEARRLSQSKDDGVVSGY